MHVQYRHCLLHIPFCVWLTSKWGMQIQRANCLLSCGVCFSIQLCSLTCFCFWMETHILEGVTLLAVFLAVLIEQLSAMRDSIWVGERDQTPTGR